jgi:hypothetical protein
VLVKQARDTKLSLTWTYPNRYTQGVFVTIAGTSQNIERGPLFFNFANAQQEQQVVEALIVWMSELKSNNVSRVQRAAPVLAGNDQIIISGARCSVLSTSPTLPARVDCTISWTHKVSSSFQAEALGKSLNGSSKQTLVIDRPSGSANAGSSYSRPSTLVARPDAVSKP